MPASTLPPPPPPAASKPPPKAAPPSSLRLSRVDKSAHRHAIVLNCQEGWGKTTLMASSPNPVMILSPAETGYVTLGGAGRVADIPYIEVSTWQDLLSLLRNPELHQFDTVCVDTISGMYAMLAAEVLAKSFENNPSKYAMYGKGDKAACIEWMPIIPALESLKKHCNILLASHSAVCSFKNPEDDNFNRYISAMANDAWAATKQWADAVLFGTFFTAVEDGKGKGGTKRVLHTEHRASHDAKNRWGMPNMIQIPDDPAKVYETVFNHIPGAKR